MNGPASLNASTLQIVDPDITYSLVIDLSISSMYGRVVVKMEDRFCTDQAGNLFTRKNSSIVIHFGKSSDRDIQKIVSFSKCLKLSSVSLDRTSQLLRDNLFSKWLVLEIFKHL